MLDNFSVGDKGKDQKEAKTAFWEQEQINKTVTLNMLLKADEKTLTRLREKCMRKTGKGLRGREMVGHNIV